MKNVIFKVHLKYYILIDLKQEIRINLNLLNYVEIQKYYQSFYKVMFKKKCL